MKIKGIDRKLTSVLPDLSVAHYLQNNRTAVEGEMRWRRGMAKSSLAAQSGAVTALGATNNKAGQFLAMQVGTTIEGLPSGAALWGDVALVAPTIAVSAAGVATLSRGSSYARSFLLVSSTGREGGPIIPVGEVTILPYQTNVNTNVTDLATYYSAQEKFGSYIGPRSAWVYPANLGSVWTSRTSSDDHNYKGVAYGNGILVAVADNASNGVMRSTDDGVTWTTQVSAQPNTSWNAVTYGNGLFVAVGSATYASGYVQVMTSPDGITWTGRTVPQIAASTIGTWTGVTYGTPNGSPLYVAVSSIGDASNIMTSPDGVTWTQRTKIDDSQLATVAWGNGVFVTLTTLATGLYCVFTSTDGITWTERVGLSSGSTVWRSMVFGGGQFVAVRGAGTAAQRVSTSRDGITWSFQTSFANAWFAVAYGAGTFVATSTSSPFPVMTSRDGVTWASHVPAVLQQWNAVVFGLNQFVAVSSSGTGNRVQTAP